MTAKYGLPYFQNFVNSELEPDMVRSMCCRLQLDLRELLKRGNGLFGSAEQTGSAGRGHRQLRPPGLSARGRRSRRCWPRWTACWNWARTAWKSSAR